MKKSETNSKTLTEIVNESVFPLEHSGDFGWSILHGDMLQIVKAFEPNVFDGVVTDPPYASGGWKQNEKNRSTVQKYSNMNSEKALPDFDGDCKDQRSWTHWMAAWLYEVRKACKPGAPICLFIDWRQYPSITDAQQNKLFALMYELEKWDIEPSKTDIGERLRGIIKRELHIDAPRGDKKFQFLTRVHACRLIDVLKKYVENAELKYLHSGKAARG